METDWVWQRREPDDLTLGSPNKDRDSADGKVDKKSKSKKEKIDKKDKDKKLKGEDKKQKSGEKNQKSEEKKQKNDEKKVKNDDKKVKNDKKSKKDQNHVNETATEQNNTITNTKKSINKESSKQAKKKSKSVERVRQYDQSFLSVSDTEASRKSDISTSSTESFRSSNVDLKAYTVSQAQDLFGKPKSPRSTEDIRNSKVVEVRRCNGDLYSNQYVGAKLAKLSPYTGTSPGERIKNNSSYNSNSLSNLKSNNMNHASLPKSLNDSRGNQNGHNRNVAQNTMDGTGKYDNVNLLPAASDGAISSPNEKVTPTKTFNSDLLLAKKPGSSMDYQYYMKYYQTLPRRKKVKETIGTTPT
ncbi:unnamed protein product, partial [Owenia fusiformis]